MAMPGSGSIELRSCYDSVACSSIGCAVCSALQTPTSLVTMSNATGRAKCMTAFYGYSTTANKAVGLCCIAGCSTGTLGVSANVMRNNCICVNPAMTVGQSVCVGLTICLRPNCCTGSLTNYTLYCQGGAVATCQVNYVITCNVTASFTLHYGETACIINCAIRGCATCGVCSYSCAIVCSAANIVGFFAPGGTTSCCVNTA